MKVLKFGGSSVGCIENLLKVKEIVKRVNHDVIIVVSAFGGITDQILNMAKVAATTKTFDTEQMTTIANRHLNAVQALVSSHLQIATINLVQARLNELENMLRGVSMIGELSARTLDRVGGMGEMLSSTIVAAFLEARWVNSMDLIRTDSSFLKAEVDYVITNENIQNELAGFTGVAVAPGFVASNSEGIPTTLGRGGSDLSASIYAAALNVAALEIWTDVNGFMTADPRVIRKAYTIDYLTYAEAMELSHFGAKVIYPPTILPVYRKRIPVWIKNTGCSDEAGTLIGQEKRYAKEQRPIKGISSISEIAMLTLQGAGMVGVTGISMRMFTALAQAKINVILISQASSENSISIAIVSSDINAAKNAIEQEFKHEINVGYINGVLVEDNLSIVAIVGENMKESAGIAGKLFSTLGKNGINIRAIAQGGSEINISWVVKTDDLRKALNVVHESFFLSSYKELNLFVVGIGTVGGNFLQQLKQQQKKLLENNRLKLKLVGVANSKKMRFEHDGMELDNYKTLLDQSDLKSDFGGFVNQMKSLNLFNSVFIDCTANEQLAGHYHAILDARISIVAANKIAASSEYTNYKSLKNLALNNGIKFFFETNVGAGLPILSTIKDLVTSGDHILKIEAVLSGTLNFIFNTLSEQVSLSKAIMMAKEAGFSEPDPRIDLSGKDVMRKLLILAREAGYPMEEEQIKVEKFIPEKLFEGNIENFWEGVGLLDSTFETQRKTLALQNKRWRFIATLDNGIAEVKLRTVEQNSPFFDLEGSNNIILITTERYNEFPMQIKGYGAGAGVTAAGVFADVIRIANI